MPTTVKAKNQRKTMPTTVKEKNVNKTIPLPQKILKTAEREAGIEGISSCAVLRRIILRHYNVKK